MIRAGSMRHVITIEEPIEIKDDQGENVIVWDDIGTTRASINPVTGNESFINAEIINEVTHKIGMRFRELNPKARLIFNNRIFNVVQSLNFEEKNVNLIVLVKERL